MNIVHARPPNFDAIAAVFPQAVGKPVVFCYGDTIYNPERTSVPPEIVAHETAHSKRQSDLGGPEGWWNAYIVDPQFRLGEEIIAHREEYRAYCQRPDIDKPCNGFRSLRLFHLNAIARRLASPLYGGLISVAEAKRIIGAEA
jgi:hypothetical protein